MCFQLPTVIDTLSYICFQLPTVIDTLSYIVIVRLNCVSSRRARHLEARAEALQNQLDKVMAARNKHGKKRGASTMRLRVSGRAIYVHYAPFMTR